MKEGAKLLGHPIHPMLIVFPLGLLATAVAFDIVGLVQGDNSWFGVSYWMIAAGVIGGLLAAVFGLVDWIAIPSGTRAKNIGLLHGGTNLLVMLLFLVSWFIRSSADSHVPGTAALVCWFLGWVLVLVGGWLGGETRRSAWNRSGSGCAPQCFEFTFRPNRSRERLATEFAKGSVELEELRRRDTELRFDFLR